MIITQTVHSPSKLTYSSRKNPCPVCGRTKDSDCRWSDICHCRTYAKEHLRVGQVVQGSDGQQWAYLGDSDGGRWAMFKPHEERRRDDRKPNLPSPAKRPTAPAKPAPKVSTPSTAKRPRPAGQQDFIYHDADGNPVIKVQRTDYGNGEKSFSQFRYENSQWIAGLNERVTQRVRLYRIAEARALSESTGHPIFLVEGESCVERLMALGIPATTSIGGAKKWTGYGYPNYLQDLSNFRVVLCPDADFCGLNHMLEVEKSLRAHGIEVAGWLLAPPDAPWENLPEGGGLDVVDWLENGATAQQILDSVRVALPAHLVVDDEVEDLATEVSELVQLDQPSRVTLLPKELDTPLSRLSGGLGLPAEPYYLTLLCVTASLLPSLTRLEIDSRFGFEAPPIMWGGLVGEPGSGKTHILNTLAKPLKDIQGEYSIRYQHQLEVYQSALQQYKKRKEPDAEEPSRPKPISLFCSNYTLEAVAQILGNQPDRGLLVNPDELAVFLKSMDAYRRGRGADRAHWLNFYNGDAMKVDRKSSDQVYVRYTSVSVIGGIQPSILRKIWEEDKEFGDGLWSRFSWVKVPLVPEPDTEPDTPEDLAQELRQILLTVYRRLQNLPPMKFVLDDEGRRLWDEWKREINDAIRSEPNEQIRACLPKVKERAARVALILHHLDAACAGVTPSKVLPASTLARAIQFTRWLHGQTQLLYAELGESTSPEVSRILRFVDRFKGAGPITLKRVRNWWASRRKPPTAEIRKFLDGVVSMGYARWVDPEKRLVEVLSHSCSHCSHPEPEPPVQSGSEQVTELWSPVVNGNHSATPPNSDRPPESTPSRQRKESPQQAPLPLDNPTTSPRGFKPKGFGSPQAESADGIPPWLWER